VGQIVRGRPDAASKRNQNHGKAADVFDPLVEAIGYIKAGKLRMLAITSATRSATLTDIPTVGEFVPGYEASGWSGMGAPKITPVEIIDKLNKEITAELAGRP
jgi:tripartite-type tricarboxylate transporter receptor subunit TctC